MYKKCDFEKILLSQYIIDFLRICYTINPFFDQYVGYLVLYCHPSNINFEKLEEILKTEKNVLVFEKGQKTNLINIITLMYK